MSLFPALRSAVYRPQRAIRATTGSHFRTLTTPSPVALADVRPGPALSQTNKAEITLRRFWKHVHIQPQPSGGHVVTLDHRNLKTPGGKLLLIPQSQRLLATLIANEWENQDEVLKQHALPLTSLASRALDSLTDPAIHAGVIDALLKYLDTDTICYPSDEPPNLALKQEQHWKPLFKWLKTTYKVDLRTAHGLSPAKQSAETKQILRSVVEDMDIWELAAFERAVYASKSFVIALALCKHRLTANEASDAAHVEVRSQIEKWGEVEDTHDVDFHDIRRLLGSVSCLLVKS
ncbi:hypothetical protein P7C73_g832, partial [Tremellales sp. Uapishka_1]